MNFAAALHTPSDLHATVHLCGDLGQRSHVFRRVVSDVEAHLLKILHADDLARVIIIALLVLALFKSVQIVKVVFVVVYESREYIGQIVIVHLDVLI